MSAVYVRILAAIDSQDADWYAQAMRFFRQKYFGPSKSPYQFIALGQKEIVGAASADQMRQCVIARVDSPDGFVE